MKDRPEESFWEWKENSFKETLSIFSQCSGRNFAILGNDDLESYDEILNQNKVESLNCKIIQLEDGETFLVGFQYVPPTSFMTRFELKEKEREEKLVELLEKVPNHRNAVWVFHTPPYDSDLDNASDLLAGKIIKVKVGSKAVRKAIKRYQPKLFLCGHIHDSPGTTWIGNSLCINPGSPTSKNTPQALFVDLYNLKEFTFIPLN